MGKETAEQKLLKLIENPSVADAAKMPGQEAAQEIARAVHSRGFLGLTIPPFISSLFGFAKTSPGNPFQFSFGLRELNKLLLAAIAVILVFLFLDFLNGMRSLRKKIDLAVDFNTAKTSSNVLLPVKDLNAYLGLVEERSIFQPFEKKVEPQKPSVDAPPQKIAAMTEKLRLVGVSWVDSAETASAMIEDTESGVTYFVHQGERIEDLTVKTIYANQVVLTFDGEEIGIGL